MTKFSLRRKRSLATSGSQKMDSCLVLTEGLNRAILLYRRSAIDLTHSERVSTSTSSFFAHRLAYSSHASMIGLKFWCHDNETGSQYFGQMRKRYLSLWLQTTLRSPVTLWPHGAYRNSESQQEQDVEFWERPWKSICCRRAL